MYRLELIIADTLFSSFKLSSTAPDIFRLDINPESRNYIAPSYPHAPSLTEIRYTNYNFNFNNVKETDARSDHQRPIKTQSHPNPKNKFSVYPEVIPKKHFVCANLQPARQDARHVKGDICTCTYAGTDHQFESSGLATCTRPRALFPLVSHVPLATRNESEIEENTRDDRSEVWRWRRGAVHSFACMYIGLQ